MLKNNLKIQLQIITIEVFKNHKLVIHYTGELEFLNDKLEQVNQDLSKKNKLLIYKYKSCYQLSKKRSVS